MKVKAIAAALVKGHGWEESDARDVVRECADVLADIAEAGPVTAEQLAAVIHGTAQAIDPMEDDDDADEDEDEDEE